MSKAGRNDPCPCGSGKKYKKCCYNKDQRKIKTAKLMSGDAGAEKIGQIMKEQMFKSYSDPKMWQLPKFGPLEEEMKSGEPQQEPAMEETDAQLEESEKDDEKA